MTTEKNYDKKIIETKYGQIKITSKFKSNNLKITNLERLSFAKGKIYNKKNLSSNAKKKDTSNFVKKNGRVLRGRRKVSKCT